MTSIRKIPLPATKELKILIIPFTNFNFMYPVSLYEVKSLLPNSLHHSNIAQPFFPYTKLLWISKQLKQKYFGHFIKLQSIDSDILFNVP